MDVVVEALLHLVTPMGLFWMVLGTVLGVLVGAIPGLTGAMLIALTLPLTYQLKMSSADALILLVSMYVGSISGGLITATLLRMPGTPASIVTTLDGYPLARSGKPGRALGLGIMASFVGGMISWVFLLVLAKPMADLATQLGPYDFFALVLMAMVLIASVSTGSLLKGILSGSLGILATMPGSSPIDGSLRWTFGMTELNNGLALLPVLIGLFAISQLVQDVLDVETVPEAINPDRSGMLRTLLDTLRQWVNLLRSSVLGTWIGILPGIGANIGSIAAYSAAQKFSKTPEQFGHGSEEGIVASEAANNATVGGALVPLVAMGIPGSVIDAILLGAMVVHGVTPGPLLFKSNPDIVYTIIGTVFLANIAMLVFMVLASGWIAQLTNVPRAYLVPIILVFCVVGSYALNNRMFDVWVMLAFGAVGFAMERGKLPLAPFVIGFVLAPVAERELGKGLIEHRGSLWPLVTEPVSLTFFTAAVLIFVWPFVSRVRGGNRGDADETTIVENEADGAPNDQRGEVRT